MFTSKMFAVPKKMVLQVLVSFYLLQLTDNSYLMRDFPNWKNKRQKRKNNTHEDSVLDLLTPICCRGGSRGTSNNCVGEQTVIIFREQFLLSYTGVRRTLNPPVCFSNLLMLFLLFFHKRYSYECNLCSNYSGFSELILSLLMKISN